MWWNCKDVRIMVQWDSTSCSLAQDGRHRAAVNMALHYHIPKNAWNLTSWATLTSIGLSSMELTSQSMWRHNEYNTNSSQLPHLHTWLRRATGRSRAWSVCPTCCSSENIQDHNFGHCAYTHKITVLWTHQWWPNDPWWHSVLFLQLDGVLFDTDRTYNRLQVQHHGYEALQMAAPSIFHLQTHGTIVLYMLNTPHTISTHISWTLWSLSYLSHPCLFMRFLPKAGFHKINNVCSKGVLVSTDWNVHQYQKRNLGM